MEDKNRGVWLAVVVIVIIACCGLLACTVAGLGLLAWPSLERFSEWSSAPGVEDAAQEQRITQSFDAGSGPTLWIKSFAGGVIIQGDDTDEIRVIATKKARSKDGLDQIEVTMTERDGGLEIRTRNPSRVPNASVELELTVPAATPLEVDLAAGAVVVQGLTGGMRADTAAGAIVLEEVSGGIYAHTAAGFVGAREIQGPVDLASAAGVIEYQGVPQGDCRFSTATGGISLELPARPEVAVDLRASIGAVNAACDVEGRSTGRTIRGFIGSGAQGTVTARATLGNINLVCR
jgi:hypothetical protein